MEEDIIFLEATSIKTNNQNDNLNNSSSTASTRRQTRRFLSLQYIGIFCLFCLGQVVFNVVITSRSMGFTISTEDSSKLLHNLFTNRQQEQEERQQYIQSAKPIRYDIVKEDDYIYNKRLDLGWDSSPIVLEDFKLIFFTIPKVGCTIWKQLFRRMEGDRDWYKQDWWDKMLPHNPETNGLKYLYDFPIERASVMMTSPEWSRAIMVRDPKIRLLTTYIDKVVEHNGDHIANRCCPWDSQRWCVNDVKNNISNFLQLCQTCADEHWRPQNDRVDAKYWPYMTHILHLETAARDAKSLLKRVGAWEHYGKHGWGPTNNESIFETHHHNKNRHSPEKLWTYLTPELELKIEYVYHNDYTNPLFQFSKGKCLTCA